MTYFYTYGFHSSLNCDTFKRIKTGLGIHPIELEYNNAGLFNENISWLQDQIIQNITQHNIKEFAFIGNSLGAFYLSQLTSLNIIKPQFLNPKICYFFNPLRDPILQLKKYIGENYNTTTQKNFYFSKEAWQSYKGYINHSGDLVEGIKRFIFIALEDELIHANDSIQYWENRSTIISFNGGHTIEDFSPFKRYFN